MRNAEDEKKYKKALRFIYKFGQETNKLTDEAIEACKRQGINSDDLISKTVEDFAVHPQGSVSPPKSKHQAELMQSEASLAEVRYKHHHNRRKVMVLRLYDYMCVMSTIPTINPSLNITSNTKSKTTLNSGFGNLTTKSNRGKLSPFRADQQMVAGELKKMGKDQEREKFGNIVSNLPMIQKKPFKLKANEKLSLTQKKFKRKASVPAAVTKSAAVRATHSVGPPQSQSAEPSMIDVNATTAAQTTTNSVAGGRSNNNQYTSYFYTPKDNLFDSKRGSRYDKGQKPFHLSQPDTNLAKFVFSNQESKKKPSES